MRILLAEDNATNEKVARHLLSKLGHTAVAVGNGEELLELLANDLAFDCILMDIAMPEMDGIEATRRLFRLIPNAAERPPVIAVTANAFESDREQCMAVGMTDFIAKPLRLSNLRDALENLDSKGATEPEAKSLAIDVEHFDMMIDGGDEEMVEIFNDFCEESTRLVAHMEASFGAKDSDGFAKVAHQLKGSSATFGMVAFSNRMAGLESTANSEGLDSVSPDWPQEVREAFEETLAELRARL